MDRFVSVAHLERVGSRFVGAAGQERAMSEAMVYPGVSAERIQLNLKRLVEDYERRLITEALERARGNQRRAAADLGVLPTTLNEKMRRLGLRACDQPVAFEIQEAVCSEAFERAGH
jgi:DNA-binding NtrC family response regulator